VRCDLGGKDSRCLQIRKNVEFCGQELSFPIVCGFESWQEFKLTIPQNAAKSIVVLDRWRV
jgi:hypothetical protein